MEEHLLWEILTRTETEALDLLKTQMFEVVTLFRDAFTPVTEASGYCGYHALLIAWERHFGKKFGTGDKNRLQQFVSETSGKAKSALAKAKARGASVDRDIKSLDLAIRAAQRGDKTLDEEAWATELIMENWSEDFSMNMWNNAEEEQKPLSHVNGSNCCIVYSYPTIAKALGKKTTNITNTGGHWEVIDLKPPTAEDLLRNLLEKLKGYVE